MEKKEKGLKILVSGFRREDLIWRIKDLLLDMVTIKHQIHAQSELQPSAGPHLARHVRGTTS